MTMRYLGASIGHRIWHLLPQPEPITKPRRRKGTHGDSESALFPGNDEEFESDGDYDDALEDLDDYIRDLEDNAEDGEEGGEDAGDGVEDFEGEREDFGYDDPDSVQVRDSEEGAEDDEDDFGPEGDNTQIDDNAFDLRGFAEL